VDVWIQEEKPASTNESAKYRRMTKQSLGVLQQIAQHRAVKHGPGYGRLLRPNGLFKFSKSNQAAGTPHQNLYRGFPQRVRDCNSYIESCPVDSGMLELPI
jgi:hypothetical protein